MSKLTFSITKPGHEDEDSIYDEIREIIEDFFSEKNKEIASGLKFTWYDNQPVSPGVALTVEFHDLKSFDLLSKLQIHLNKYDYLIFIVLGY